MRRRKKRKINYNKFLILIIMILVVYLYKNVSYSNFNSVENNNSINNTNILDELDIYFIDVGQADSIYIKSGNSNVLIDAGNNEDGKLLVKYLSSLGVSSFDYVFGTHAHEDHIGGLDDVIDNFDIKNFYMPDKISTSKTFEDVLDSLEKKSIKFSTPNIGDEYNIDNAKLTVLYLDSKASNYNDSSIVLRLDYGSKCALFMGDASNSVEENLLNKNISCDILKVGHHGSRTSSSDEFIKEVNPSYAVISVGVGNSYGHPTSEALNILEKYNVKVYRTDEEGTIIAKLKGDSIEFTSERTDTNG